MNYDNMKDIEGRLSSYKEAPWSHKNMVFEDENLVVFKDGFPVTEGHLLFVPKKVTQQIDITRCFELAYKWGVKGVCDYKWEAFNVGINNGEAAGQSVMWPHVHLIPRRKGDTPNPLFKLYFHFLLPCQLHVVLNQCFFQILNFSPAAFFLMNFALEKTT